MTRTRLVRALVAAALGLAAAAAAAQETKIKFTLDWRIEGPSVVFLLPYYKGYFKQEGLDVTIDIGIGSGAAVQRIASGAYDMGAGDLSALIEFLGNNPGPLPMQAVYLIYETAPGAVFAYKKSGITKPGDLAGKRLGGPVFDAVRKAFPLVLKAQGLDPNSITWVTMEPQLREQMLVKGEVDVITAFYATGLLNLNARGVKTEELVWFKLADLGVRNMYGNVVLASTKLINENPKAVAGFVRAVNRGMREALADPAAAMKFAKQRDSLIDEALEVTRLKLAMEDMLTPNVRSDGHGSIRKLKLESQVDDVTSAYGLKSKPNPDTIFNSTFLPPKSERMPQ